MFLHLYLDVQLYNTLDLKTAHDIVDDFEQKIKEQISEIKYGTTHIETETDIEFSVGKRKDLINIFQIKQKILHYL